ncbi:preprotein translocase subunit SecE [Pseudofrankia asymbiotica]|uniref:Protein translocase subunit SecE n=1 Tax=Pseudofrankia asymbiotica TaxID=1834516 RepID=A0A1V2ICJ8_9ACTN|nr:preprotein translocase subunit SecE [Pseudofrankia asymbiotica]ONH29903.1 preprotein translocase subunit SecE [Pseudofrankia asymbiotica]
MAATDTDAPARVNQPARAGGRRRTSPLRFYREVVAELRKVVYPSRTELITYVVVVLIFVSVMTAIVASLDFGLTKLVLQIFG